MAPAPAPQPIDDDEPTDPGSYRSGVVCDAGRVYGVDFEVVALVASGGMGEVYKVKNLRTGRFHAMKVMRPELVRDPALVDRFEKEGIALTRFKHRGVVRAEQVGYDRDVGPYIIMELLEGMTLAELMARYGRRLPPTQGIPILIEVALALELIHQQGIFHRDIKPQNIFLHRAEGQPRETKVLDFGAMKARSTSLHFASTDSSKTIGTPRYMAPEQLVARPVGAFTDVYALGVVAYEILSFSSLFGTEVERASIDEIRMFHLFAERVPLHHVASDVPASLWDAIERATRREPGARTPTMQRFADELKRALDDVIAREAAGRDASPGPDSPGPDSDSAALEAVRAQIAKRATVKQQAEDASRGGEAGPAADAPFRATAYGLHLVDLGALDAAAGVGGVSANDARPEGSGDVEGAAGLRSGEHVVVDVETMMRERRDLAAKLAAYHKARAELGTLPPLDPAAVRKLLDEIDARIAVAARSQGAALQSARLHGGDWLSTGVVQSARLQQPSVTSPLRDGPSRSMLGHLLGVAGPAASCDRHVGIVPLRIGRDESCQLVLDDEKVSALHATIGRAAKGDFEIVDADSTNGTRVNGRPIKRTVLQVGDRIGIGASTLEFRLVERHVKRPRRRTVRDSGIPVEPSSPAVATHIDPVPPRTPRARLATPTEWLAVAGAFASVLLLAAVVTFGPPRASRVGALRRNPVVRDVARLASTASTASAAAAHTEETAVPRARGAGGER